jgi:hypothetical protein
MTDAYTSTVVLACGIGVKETGGTTMRSHAAGLEKIRSMKVSVEQTLLQPLLGWAVIGLKTLLD